MPKEDLDQFYALMDNPDLDLSYRDALKIAGFRCPGATKKARNRAYNQKGYELMKNRPNIEARRQERQNALKQAAQSVQTTNPEGFSCAFAQLPADLQAVFNRLDPNTRQFLITCESRPEDAGALRDSLEYAQLIERHPDLFKDFYSTAEIRNRHTIPFDKDFVPETFKDYVRRRLAGDPPPPPEKPPLDHRDDPTFR